MPVEMPADFVVRDIDGTTRAERPRPRAEAPPPRAERSRPAPKRGPIFVMSVEFWLIVIAVSLVALFFIVRLIALSSLH